MMAIKINVTKMAAKLGLEQDALLKNDVLELLSRQSEQIFLSSVQCFTKSLEVLAMKEDTPLLLLAILLKGSD